MRTIKGVCWSPNHKQLLQYIGIKHSNSTIKQQQNGIHTATSFVNSNTCSHSQRRSQNTNSITGNSLAPLYCVQVRHNHTASTPSDTSSSPVTPTPSLSPASSMAMNAARPSHDISSLNDTLHHLTSIKLAELSRRKGRLEDYYDPILQETSAQTDQKTRFKALQDAMDVGGRKNIKFKTDVHIKNLKHMTALCDVDLGLGGAVLKEHSDTFVKGVEEAKMRYQYSLLFGKIFSEWLVTEGLGKEGEEVDVDVVEDGSSSGTSSASSTASSFVETGRPEMLEQKAKLESIIYDPSPADTQGFIELLCELWGQDKTKHLEDAKDDDLISAENEEASRENDARKAIRDVRVSLKHYGKQLKRTTVVTNDDVKDAIGGLMADSLLSDEKKRTCREILLSQTIVSELASVLTMTLRDLDEWQWSDGGVNMVFRRALNGKYRCYLDEGIVEAIFLQYVGTLWAVKLKNVLRLVRVNDRVWRQPKTEMTDKQKEIWQHMITVPAKRSSSAGVRLNRMAANRDHSILDVREDELARDFFLAVLPDEKSHARFRQAYENEDDDSDGDASHHKKQMSGELKQRALQRLLTDAQYTLHATPDRKFTAVHADFEWFGPSLSHDVLLASLQFLGMPQDWLTFFTKFLRVPCKFVQEDEVKTRQRGVPISHSVSNLLAEVLLWHLDFAVNQASGKQVHYYRLHDDIWFWSTDGDAALKAWKTLQDFSDIIAVPLNKEKCGSVVVSKEAGDGVVNFGPAPLPQSSLSWGFIEMHSNGVFKVKQSDVDVHTKEMARQLANQKSVLGYINAYNKYMAFFIRNFAQPVRIFGPGHVQQIIDTMNNIHRTLFPETDGNVLAKFALLIQERFPDASPPNILEAWMLLPMSYGGLGAQNFALKLYPILKSFMNEQKPGKDPRLSFAAVLQDEKKEYRTYKDRWNERLYWPYMGHILSSTDYDTYTHDASRSSCMDKPTFLSFEEFVRDRQSHSTLWSHVWQKSGEGVEAASPEVTGGIERALREFCEVEGMGRPFVGKWGELENYWRWVLCVYGRQLVGTFGGLDMMDRKLIPLGMIDAFKGVKVRWE